MSELSELMQAEGLTPPRIRFLAPTVTQVLDPWSTDDIRDWIATTLTEGDQNKYSVALTYAFGIRGQTGKAALLAQRRQMARDGENWDVSDDTLMRWERRGIELLIDDLFDRREATPEERPGLVAQADELKSEVGRAIDQMKSYGTNQAALDDLKELEELQRTIEALRARLAD